MEENPEREEAVPDAAGNRALAQAFEETLNHGGNPEIVILAQGRSMYEVKDGHAFIKVSLEDKAHWGEAIAHEMGHWACRHVTPPDLEAMYRQELEAWEWAMKKGLKFDRKFVEECLFTHALELREAQEVVNAMIRGDSLISQYEHNSKIM